MADYSGFLPEFSPTPNGSIGNRRDRRFVVGNTVRWIPTPRHYQFTTQAGRRQSAGAPPGGIVGGELVPAEVSLQGPAVVDAPGLRRGGAGTCATWVDVSPLVPRHTPDLDDTNRTLGPERW